MDGIDERNRELTDVYRRIMAANPDITHADACSMAVNSPASRWWVGYSYVYRELLRRVKGRSLADDPIFRRIKRHSPQRVKVYDALWERYKELAARREFQGCSTLFLTSFVLNEQAPSFLIRADYGKKIIERELRRARRERKQRLEDGEND